MKRVESKKKVIIDTRDPNNTTFSLRFHKDIANILETQAHKEGITRNKLILKCCKTYLEKRKDITYSTPATITEKIDAIEFTQSMSKAMDDKILNEINKRTNLIQSIDDEALIKLATARLPKQETGEEINKEILSLKNSINQLPEIPDITQKLNQTLLELAQTKTLLELAKTKFTPNQENIQTIFQNIHEYIKELISRKSITGFNDQKGVSDIYIAKTINTIQKEITQVQNEFITPIHS